MSSDMRSVPHLKTMTVLSSAAVLDLNASTSTASWQWPTMSPPYAGRVYSKLEIPTTLRMVIPSLTSEAAMTLTRIYQQPSWLLEQSAVLYGISDGLLTKLQTVQNAAGRVIIVTTKFDHISLLQCCVNSTGFPYGSESPSSWLWSLNAFTVWHRPTWLTCVSPFRPSSTGESCGLQSADSGILVGETLPCRAVDMEQPPCQTADLSLLIDSCDSEDCLVDTI